MESSSQQSIEQWIQNLKPIQSIYPANQIITKTYAPQIKPTFILIKRQQKAQKQKILVESLLKHQYCELFQDEDTLGYWYSKLIQENLIYMKFNNKELMKCPTTNKKYLAGLFVPLSHLLKPQLRITKNLYKTLKQIDFNQYKNSIQDSFGNNSLCQQPQIKFSSNFQSSNLFIAVKKKQREYDLILQNDINSKGTTQWFNFAVSIFSQGKYKFNIVNLTKSCSLYQKGMKICYYSFQNKIIHKKGWSRGCTNINYFKNQIYRQGSQQSKYYTLQFQYESQFKYDTIIFSYCYPYTFLDMQKFFTKVICKKMSSTFKMEKIKLCESISGNPINIYQISLKKGQTIRKIMSTNLFSLTNQNTFVKKDRSWNSKAIVFMARQHSGQTQGSFITQGIVEFLLQNNEYQGYKKSYTYYIIPMINVDGVYYGNYRTNLSGADLNRIWRYPRKDFNSQIFYLKKFLNSINKTTPISLIIDIHGHSTSLNSFFYGNPSKKESVSYNVENSKLFPYFCSKRIKQISFNQSTFTISEDKKNSARVVLNQMFPKALVYTFQNSFFGFKKGKHVEEYTIDILKKIGRDLITCYLQYEKISEKNTTIKQKWEKQIQSLMCKTKKDNQIVISQSDSQAQNQLIGFQNQLENIEQVQFSTNRHFIQDKIPQVQKKFKLSHKKRISADVRLKKRTSLSPKNPSNQILNETSQTGNQLVYKPQGFLSIVKIDTKQNPINNTLHTLHALNEKRNKLMSCKISKTQKETKYLQNLDKQKQNFKQNQKNNTFFKLVSQNDYLKQQKEDYLIKTVNFQKNKIKNGVKGNYMLSIQKKF